MCRYSLLTHKGGELSQGRLTPDLPSFFSFLPSFPSFLPSFLPSFVSFFSFLSSLAFTKPSPSKAASGHPQPLHTLSVHSSAWESTQIVDINKCRNLGVGWEAIVHLYSISWKYQRIPPSSLDLSPKHGTGSLLDARSCLLSQVPYFFFNDAKPPSHC